MQSNKFQFDVEKNPSLAKRMNDELCTANPELVIYKKR